MDRDRGGGAPARRSGREQPSTDAHLAITLIQQSISGADGKAGILGTAGAVVVGLVANSLDVTVLGGGSAGEIAWTVLGVATLACVLMVGVELAGVLVPRVAATHPSRYAWPAIQDVDLDVLVGADPGTERREAWAEAQMLARISARKHAHLRRAMAWFGGAAAVATVWALVGASIA